MVVLARRRRITPGRGANGERFGLTSLASSTTTFREGHPATPFPRPIHMPATSPCSPDAACGPRVTEGRKEDHNTCAKVLHARRLQIDGRFD